MKKHVVLLLLLSFLFILVPRNILSQQKKFYLGLQGGVFLPSSDIIYGYQATSYGNGSPDGVLANGFGNGGDINLRFQYFFSDLGIHFDGGARILRRYIHMSIAPDGDVVEYDNTLNLFPIELGLVYRFVPGNNKVIPYYSAGICGYYGTMGRNYKYADNPRESYQGSAFSLGLYHALGMYLAIYHDLLFNVEIKMNYANGTWELENQDEGTDESIKYDKHNTGGTAFKAGFAFRF
jgi:outer membrane protein W